MRVAHAKGLAELNVHKQELNRMLEPFLWHTVIVTATEWENFFELRCASNAQPEIREAALRMRQAVEASSPAAGCQSNGTRRCCKPTSTVWTSRRASGFRRRAALEFRT